jgi:hypothetical protein
LKKEFIDMAGRPSKPLKPQGDPTSAVWLPEDIAHRYRISKATRALWERKNKLPKRDVFIAGKPHGWLRETILKAEKEEATA